MIASFVFLVSDCDWTAKGPTTKEPRVLIESPEFAKETVVRALHLWASATDLRFEIVTSNPDLTIRQFAPGECGITSMAGEFATDSLVAVREWDSPKLLSFLLHGIGHWLGFGHSDNRASVMFPMIQEQRFDDIDASDEDAVTSRYGKPQLNKWTVCEPLAWGRFRYRGIGLPPVGATGRGVNWSVVTDSRI